MDPPPSSRASKPVERQDQPIARAKPLPRAARWAEPPALVPARMVNEVLYCERLFYLEWVQGEFQDNVFTVDGRAVHRRSDRSGGELPPRPSDRTADITHPALDDDPDAEAPPYRARSVWLSSDRLALTAKIDVVEGEADGTVVPIEYKRGSAPDVPEGAYLPERAQLCAQVLLLREHGYRCDDAALYFARNKRRVLIPIDQTLIDQTLGAVQRARTLAASEAMPPPLVDSPKCVGCSLVGICLPDEVNLLARQQPSNDEAPGADVDEAPQGRAIRRLHPARDDRLPVYVQTQGARVGLDGEVLVVRSPDGSTAEARIPQTSQVCLMGNAQVSTQALRALLDRGIPVSFFTTGGFYVGRTVAHDSKNVELRIAQYRAADDPAFCLDLARRLVLSKVKNCRTMLRRNHAEPDPVVLGELDQLARKAADADSIPTLLGLEGTAARYYFGAFRGMLGRYVDFDIDGRNRRPPRDPINALLSLAYSLLSKELTVATSAVGLDPMRGFYHQPHFGRPSLALDLMEEFRPLLADSTVIGAINQNIVTPDDFHIHPTGVSLGTPARRRFILSYERRLDQLVTHPVFGYRISYRRVLEVQARLLSRLLLGELSEYPTFRTR
jgi:CRISPR-associated protein Cas1